MPPIEICKIVMNPLYFRSDSLYITNQDAGEGESEANDVDPNEIIVWNRPDDFMGGMSALNGDNEQLKVIRID